MSKAVVEAQALTRPDQLRWGTLANKVTAARLVLAVILFALMEFACWKSALVLFIVAVASDALDGYLARKRGEVTAVGRILDPFADKIVIVGAFIFLIPWQVSIRPWMVTVIVARELLVSSIRSYLESKGIPFGADWGGKLKMILQSVCVAWVLMVLGWKLQASWATGTQLALIWSAVLATLFSGVHYFWRAVVLIRGSNAVTSAA